MSDLFMKSIGMQPHHHHHQHQHHHRDQRRRSTAPGRSSSERSNATASQSTMEDDCGGGGGGGGFENLLSLQLRKPKNWKWELNTSRSCHNIALPRILLFDYKGDLLLDTPGGNEECCIQQDDVIVDVINATSHRRSQTRRRREQSRSPTTIVSSMPAATATTMKSQTKSQSQSNRAVTLDLAHSIQRVLLDRELNDLQINEATPSPNGSSNDHHENMQSFNYRRPSSFSSSSAISMVSGITGNSGIDFFTNDLPDFRNTNGAYNNNNNNNNGSGSGSMRSVHFDEQNHMMNNDGVGVGIGIGIGIGTIATPTTTGSSSSGQREKRRYRRSRSTGRRSPSMAVNSESILERFSYNRGRFSSPETAEETDLPNAPRYYLRTSKAGTLMVRDESFSNCRRRIVAKPSRSASSSDSLAAINGTINNGGGHLSSGKVRSRSTSLLRIADISSADGSGNSSLHNISESPERRQWNYGNGRINTMANNVAPEPWRRSRTTTRQHRSDGNFLLLTKQLQNEFVQENDDDDDVECGTTNTPIQQRRYATYRRQSKKDLPTIDSGNETVSHHRPDRTAR